MLFKTYILVNKSPKNKGVDHKMEQVKISFYAPKSLRTKLNVIAATQDRTVTSILTELVEDFVRENE